MKLRFPKWTISAAPCLKQMRNQIAIVLIGLACTFGCSGLELVHLKNGFSLEADSHTNEDSSTILRIGAGTMVVDQADISSIEVVPDSLAAAELKKVAAGKPGPERLLADAAEAYGVDPAFVRSVAQIESGLREDAISQKGAIGLMQLMPGTAAELNVNPNESAANASGGARYLRELLLRYKGDSVLALAAYNAGPGAVQKFGGAPPFRETRQYITAVLQEYKRQLHVQTQLKAPEQKSAARRANKPSATN